MIADAATVPTVLVVAAALAAVLILAGLFAWVEEQFEESHRRKRQLQAEVEAIRQAWKDEARRLFDEATSEELAG